jgi:hypothetical protein
VSRITSDDESFARAIAPSHRAPQQLLPSKPDLRRTGTYALGFLLLAAAFAVALSPLFNRPSRVAKVWPGAKAASDTAPAVRAQVMRATWRSVAFVLAVAALDLLPSLFFNVPIFVRALPPIMVAAVLLDVWEEQRFRSKHPRLSAVWPIQRVYAVAPALDALAAAGIKAFPRALRYRTLLQFFGPYAPVTLLVPEARAAEAERIVRERLLEPAIQGKTEAGASEEPEARSA